MQSSAATSSASVELLVFIFCFLEIDITAPSPIVILPPVWLLKSGWTAKAASTNHVIILVLFADKVSGIVLVPFKYFTKQSNLAASVKLGAFTLKHSVTTVGWMSGLDLLLINRHLATSVWNNSFDHWDSFALSSVLNKLVLAGVGDMSVSLYLAG